MKQLVRWIRWAPFAGLALACGATGDDLFQGTQSQQEGPSISALPQALAEVYCATLEACTGPLMKLQFEDQSCVGMFSKVIADGEFSLLEEAVAGGKVSYHPEHVETCLAALREKRCDLFTSRLTPECDQTILGTVELGGACSLDFECASSNAFCQTDGMCPGACAALLAEDTPCAEDDHCQDGLVCDAGLKTCRSPAQLGEACQGDDPECGAGLLCWFNGEQEDRECIHAETALAADPGAACDIATGALCTVGNHCVLALGASTQELTQVCEGEVLSGAPCGRAFPDQCPGGEYCSVTESSNGQNLRGTCTPLPPAGSPCLEDSEMRVCSAGTACVEGTCETRVRLNDSCSGDDACYSGACDAGVCVPDVSCLP